MDKYIIIFLALYSSASFADNRSNQMNPNNSAYSSSRASSSASNNNRSNQMNPNNSAYWSSRGSANNYRSNLNNPNNSQFKRAYDNKAAQTKALSRYSSNLNRAASLYKSKKYKESLSIFSTPIYHNEALALNHLAIMYQSGLGVEKNTETAIKLYTKAAMLNNKHAQHNLGTLYRNGNGVTKNIDIAVQWLTKAADQNLLVSVQSLSHIYFFGKEAPRDINKALNLYIKASTLGDLLSRYAVGILYIDGKDGVPKDKIIGLQWVESAAQAGLLRAQMMLSKFYCGEASEQVVLKNLKTCSKWVKLAFNNKENPQSKEASDLWSKHELWKYE